jgi:hypothetical protein
MTDHSTPQDSTPQDSNTGGGLFGGGGHVGGYVGGGATGATPRGRGQADAWPSPHQGDGPGPHQPVREANNTLRWFRFLAIPR